MADVKKCDRCGTLIDYSIHNTQHRIFKNSVVRSLLRLETRMYISDYDLCKDCTTKLTDFLKGEDSGKAMDDHPHAGGLY